MNVTTVGVDLAKDCFQIAVADERYRIQRRARLSRARFEKFLAQQPRSLFVLEACGSSQFWGRKLAGLGHEVRLLPAQYVRAYVRRNKTDAADAAALIEASRCPDIHPVPVKTVDQQQLQQLHRLREHYKHMRTSRINLLRGCLREFGIPIPKGVARGVAALRAALECGDNGLPDGLRPWIARGLADIADCKEQEREIERQLHNLVREDEMVDRWQAVPGVGLLTASATRAAVGDMERFPSGRHFASWLGVTAREHSSAERRRLGRISKRGDRYLRTLLVHGARSALQAAHRAQQADKPLDRLQRWVLATEERCGKNKATVAYANKLARILWATCRYQRAFDANWRATVSG